MSHGPGTVWSVELDAALQEYCKTMLSYSQIAEELNARFPDQRKTRNAVLGRSCRKGYRVGKPVSEDASRVDRFSGRPVPVGMLKARARKVVSVRMRNAAKKQAAVVFTGEQDSVLLRQEGDRGIVGRYRKVKSLSEGDPVLVERKKGTLPSIIEAAPLTSRPFVDCGADTCKWPTSEDITCMEVCGVKATVGAYCDRHARVAYRVMPTAKRNRQYHKDNVDYKSVTGSIMGRTAHLTVIDDLPTAHDDGVLLIPHFIGCFGE